MAFFTYVAWHAKHHKPKRGAFEHWTLPPMRLAPRYEGVRDLVCSPVRGYGLNTKRKTKPETYRPYMGGSSQRV